MVKKNKCSVIIQARLNSTRFKSKILQKINDLSILEILVKRLRKSKKIDKIIIAFPKNNLDNDLVKVCKNLNVYFYRGSEDNVIQRFYFAASKFEINDIIRITADCPLIDIETINILIEKYFNNNVDYASNVINPTYPDGIDVEIFKFKILKDQYLNHFNKLNKEHVTTGMRNNKKYKTFSLTLKRNYSKLKLSIDTQNDLKIIF